MEIGPLDYAIYEKMWYEEHKYFMGVDKHHYISSDEATEDFMENHCYSGFSLEEKCRIAYAQEKIIPALMNGKSPEKNMNWIKARLKDFFNLLDEHNLLKEIAA